MMEKKDQADRPEREAHDRELAELFRHVDPREKPPRADAIAIRQTVHQQWQASVLQRRRRWQFASASLAASLLLVVLLVVISNRAAIPGPQMMLAETVRIVGQVSLVDSEGSTRPRGTESTGLHAGQGIQTGNGSGLAMRWREGAVLRLGEASELQLFGKDQVVLVRGKLYLDTSPQGDSMPAPAIHTSQGRVMHVGTSYMTETGDFGTRVSVREGRVRFASGDSDEHRQATAQAGENLTVSTQGDMVTGEVQTWGELWSWAENLSSGLNLEDPHLDELLNWVASETGRELVYASPEVMEKARQTRLRGKISLPPDQALEAAIATSDFVARTLNGQILIDLKR